MARSELVTIAVITIVMAISIQQGMWKLTHIFSVRMTHNAIFSREKIVNFSKEKCAWVIFVVFDRDIFGNNKENLF